MPPDAKDATKRTRAIKVERPSRFNDTLARKLELSVISLSRFAAIYETAPTYVNGTEQALLRRQPLRQADQAVQSAAPLTVWMPATQRPKVPELRRPELSFRFERYRDDKTGGQVLCRRALVRIHLARGWFNSGEGERLGIVLWPPDYRNQGEADLDANLLKINKRDVHISDFEDADLGKGGAYITRWGGDPIRRDPSPQPGYLIPPRAFRDLHEDCLGKGPHKPQWVDSALVPILDAPAPEGQQEGADDSTPRPSKDYRFLRTSLATFEPCFDLDREQWYVDIDLQPIRASEPFVRFGLVRYQEHAISADLMVSEPVVTTVQLLPTREARVDLIPGKQPSGQQVKIKVSGLASLGIKDFDPAVFEGSKADHDAWKKFVDDLQHPHVRLAIFHEAPDASNGLQRRALSIAPMKAGGWQLSAAADVDSGNHQEMAWHSDNERSEWTLDCTVVPKDLLPLLGPGQLVAYLEEVDRRMPASYRYEPVEPRVLFSEYIDSGPRFSARVPFMTITGKTASEDPDEVLTPQVEG